MAGLYWRRSSSLLSSSALVSDFPNTSQHSFPANARPATGVDDAQAEREPPEGARRTHHRRRQLCDDIGVEPTVRHGNALGYHAVVAEDACGACAQDSHDRSIAFLRDWANVASSADVASVWQYKPRT